MHCRQNAVRVLIGFVARFAISANVGQWSDPVSVPISPAAAYINPSNGNVLMWSSGSPDRFGLDGEYKETYGAVFEPRTARVSAIDITEAHTDMFCPGISVAPDGLLVVAGGSSSDATSIHSQNWTDGRFTAGPRLQIPRGYQSQVTLSDGRMFTIGGSWSGGQGGKSGEVLSLKSSTWSSLPGCTSKPMLTADREGLFRSDNHAWLFGWKQGWVLQAGPSRAMNWYSTAGSGSTMRAGVRDTTDAMCGVAAMYDASNGKILTAGGSAWYNASAGLGNAAVLALGAPRSSVAVEQVASMTFPRTLHNGVVLPTGEVVIVGGQSFGHIFSDNNATTVPELWNPDTRKFTLLKDQRIARTYHSWALLLQDGRILSGGGGLCRDDLCEDPSFTHRDIQAFTPPYLLDDDDRALPRPKIRSAPISATLGSTMNVDMHSELRRPGFALMRLGSATHTVNTDQRRVPLDWKSTKDNSYTLNMPSDPGIVIPGYYFLFALDGTTPSVATILKVY